MRKKELMIKKLFIIGNGFDCYGHGLPTKYSDFRKYLINEYPNYNYDFDGILEPVFMPDGDEQYDNDEIVGSIISLMDNCVGEEWNDLESSSGTVYVNSILEKNEGYINEVDWDDEDNDIRHTVYSNEDVSNSISGGFIQLKKYFEDWAFDELTNLDFSNVKKLKKPSFKNSFFLNFNYTNTLEELYHVPEQNVCHIHGYVNNKDSDILFGHGEDENVEDFGNYLGVEDAFNSLLQGLRKDTNAAIKRNALFWKKLKGVTKIYSYGFSFSNVDMCYIDEISKQVNPNKVRWYFNSFDWKNNKANIEKIRSRGYKIRRCFRW